MRLWTWCLLWLTPVKYRAVLLLEDLQDGSAWSILDAIDHWSYHRCSQGCTSDMCCDWQRLYQVISRQPAIAPLLDI